MPKKRHKPEEIVAKLRQVDVLRFARAEPGGRCSLDWRDRGHVLSLATGVRRTEDGPGEAPEGS